MTTKHSIRNTAMAASIVGVVGFGIACTHHHAPAAYGGGPPAVQPGIDSAVERLAKEQCDREQRCGNVGAGHDYDTHAKCLTVMRGKATDDLTLDSCPGGIDQKSLGSCLSAIREQKCGLSFESFSRRNECRVAQLCYR
jgi:hypothetical protein